MKMCTKYMLIMATVWFLVGSVALATASESESESGRLGAEMGVSDYTRWLAAGYGPGTTFENAVSLAALQGNLHDLSLQFRKARKSHTPQYVTEWLNSALNLAVRAGQLRAAAFLIEQGAQVNEIAKVMMVSAQSPGKLKKGQSYFESAGTPLANAVQAVRPQMASLLLNHGADMYAAHTGAHPALRGIAVYMAVATGSTRLVNVFLEHGLDPCKITGYEYSLTQLAVKVGLPRFIQSKLVCNTSVAAPPPPPLN